MKDSLAQEYRESDHWFFRARRKLFGHVLDRWLVLPQDARVLDLGPGSGVNVPVLLERGRLAIVDVSDLSLRDCGAKGARDLVHADATRPPFRSASLDLVCALDILEHLDDDTHALDEIHRILKPGGALFLSVPAWMLLWGRQDVLSEHKRRYRRVPLATLVRGAGFELERLSYFNFLLFVPILLVRVAMRPFLRWTGGGGSDLTTPTPFGLDRLLFSLFAAERHWLARHDLPVGVSLICLARKPLASTGTSAEGA